MRVLLANNLNEIKTILNNFRDELPILKTSEEYRQNMSEKFIKYGNVLFVEEQESILGFVAFYANDLETKTAYISFIAVKNAFQKKGVGTLLLNSCEIQAQKKGMNKIRLEVKKNNTNAQCFYKNHRFDFECDASDDSFYMFKALE